MYHTYRYIYNVYIYICTRIFVILLYDLQRSPTGANFCISLREALTSDPNLCGLKSAYKDEVIWGRRPFKTRWVFGRSFFFGNAKGGSDVGLFTKRHDM